MIRSFETLIPISGSCATISTIQIRSIFRTYRELLTSLPPVSNSYSPTRDQKIAIDLESNDFKKELFRLICEINKS